MQAGEILSRHMGDLEETYNLLLDKQKKEATKEERDRKIPEMQTAFVAEADGLVLM